MTICLVLQISGSGSVFGFKHGPNWKVFIYFYLFLNMNPTTVSVQKPRGRCQMFLCFCLFVSACVNLLYSISQNITKSVA